MKRSSGVYLAADPIRTRITQEFRDVLISPITKIVNKAISLDVFFSKQIPEFYFRKTIYF